MIRPRTLEGMSFSASATGPLRGPLPCLPSSIPTGSATASTRSCRRWVCQHVAQPQGFIKTHKNEAKLKKHDTDAMRQERRALWHSVPNLHIVGECIESVRIRCRHLVLVMIHCHLSFQQVMSSVDCQDIAGVLTLPCCNYFAIQQQFMTQKPTMEFADPGIWSEKNTVRLWIRPLLVWGDDYTQTPGDACVLPLPIPCGRLVSALEMKEEELGKEVEAAGEVIAVRKFGKKLTFLFVNTSNVYYTASDDSYAYYDTDSYDDNNACRNACVIVMKLEVVAINGMNRSIPTMRRRPTSDCSVWCPN